MMHDANDSLIIPAIMPDDFPSLVVAAGRIAPFAHEAQIDVMDGAFVPSISWPYGEGQQEEIARMIAEGALLPHSDTIRYEAHLMVRDPRIIGVQYTQLGVRGIIAHAEALAGQDAGELFALWREAGAAEIGVALLLDTPLESIEPYAAQLDGIQIMGIDAIGFQGHAFDERAIERVREARSLYPQLAITVDGGVNIDTIRALAEAGASRFVAGSAIAGATDPHAAYEALRLAAGIA